VAPTAVSFINMKGGVGKTTLAFNIAHYAAQISDPPLKVLAVDLDPQANLSQCLLGAADYLEYIQENNPTTAEMFAQAMPPGKTASARAVPDPELIVNIRPRLSRTLDLVPSRLELARTLRDPLGKEEILARFLAAHASDYDLIVIDCAPTESVLTLAAYRASRYLVVPVRPEFLATVGFPMLASSLEEFRAGHQNQEIDIAGVVFNGGKRSDPPWQEFMAVSDVRGTANENGWRVFNNQVFDSRSYPNGSREGQPIFRTSYSRNIVVQEFYDVAEEFLVSVGLK